MIGKFFEFVEERQSIYLMKTAGYTILTDDPIFQEYKFCNVFRELDTTTIWIRENIRKRWAGHRYLWFALCVARRINYIPTLMELGDLLVDWDPLEANGILDARKESKRQIYNGAYMLTTGGRKVPKNDDTCWNILEPMWKNRISITVEVERTNTLKDMMCIFSNRYTGYSDFITYEVVTDMRHTRYLRNAPDIYSWANAGPGANRGLNRIHDRPLDKKIKACQANKEMLQLLQDSELYLPRQFHKLEMRDIEHSLCEFDKYERIRTGKSTRMVKYNGRK